jgi:hypothetical protein
LIQMRIDKPFETVESKPKGRASRRKTPVLLVAWAPFPLEPGENDRCAAHPPFAVGRGDQCHLVLPDRRISQTHFHIERARGGYAIEDNQSTNGTWVGGDPLPSGGTRPLASPSLILAGETVLVFLDDGERLLDTSLLDECRALGIAGRFHGSAILSQLKEAALSRRSPLLTGQSGVGKELAAAALSLFWELGPPRRYNVSAGATGDELSRALFGVAAKAYTGVEKQDGLIVTADRAGCPLFLDEVHNLPFEAQAALLTVIEDGRFSRKGAEDEELEVDSRLVLASNEPDKLKPDLRARLWSVEIPSLRDRVADVPAIFDALLDRALADAGIAQELVRPGLDGALYHDLCLEALVRDGFGTSNVRGLYDLADRIAARIAAGADPADAVDSVCEERLGPSETEPTGGGGGASQYETNRELISVVYLGCGKNVKKTVELLRASGVPWTISRRHLTNHLRKWGLKESD